jgi:Domain of unknown function (DUF2760)
MNWLEKLKNACKAFFKAFTESEKDQKLLTVSSTKQSEGSEGSHLRLLSMLQNSGRLIDFLKEDLSSFSDAQVGVAVRKIHQDCSKLLEEVVTVRPLMEENEGTSVIIPFGYDPSSIKVVGKIKGEPPFQGILIHKGWKAHKHSLPKKIGEYQNDVIAPAEVELR